MKTHNKILISLNLLILGLPAFIGNHQASGETVDPSIDTPSPLEKIFKKVDEGEYRIGNIEEFTKPIQQQTYPNYPNQRSDDYYYRVPYGGVFEPDVRIMDPKSQKDILLELDRSLTKPQ